MHTAADGLLGFLCEPPEHLIAMQPMGTDRLMVMVVIFGKEVMPYEIELPDQDRPENSWVMDPRKRKVRELQYGELIQEVGSRLDRAHRES
jgi:hypothetical protein